MLIVFSFNDGSNQPKAVDTAVVYFKTESKLFALSASNLETAIHLINNKQPATIASAKEALRNCRLHYKRIEFFLAYFFPDASLVYNAPAKYEIEEPGMEWRDPVGLQVIETLLFDADVESKKKELLQQSEVIISSAYDLNSLLYKFDGNDKQLLESIRLEVIRIIALNISGYDAPLLKSGISESFASLTSIEYCLKQFYKQESIQLDSVTYYLKSSLNYLKKSGDFDSFNRLAFLTEHALPLQQHLNKFIVHNNLQLNKSPLSYKAENLFSANAINLSSLRDSGLSTSEDIVELGRQLFSENALSGNNKRSCISCHNPEKHFTDGVAKSVGFNETSTVERNAPSLLYAGFQYSQFWDGRVSSLEEQVKHVIRNPNEMNAEYAVVIKRLQGKIKYNELFKDAFAVEKDPVTIDNVAISIAAYIRTLSPMNSAFDKYIRGDKDALTQQQVNGFNLFMGKGQCGTCHFAPLFNGLVPPLYNRTEVEILGTPKTDDFKKVQLDSDSGRFHIFPSKFYVGAFKTPTARNAAVTSPYMHNGAFHTLEKVVDFYNKGGGVGLGLKVEAQTLPSTALNLNDKEVKEIVSFLQALTDSINVSIKPAVVKSK